jgi:hypothetical protein
MPAAPSPRSSKICVKPPPNEWPMMIGGLSSPRMISRSVYVERLERRRIGVQ